MNKILVANRGEIALRIMKTARKMAIKTVAVYSEADRLSPHVRFADEAVLIGPPPSSRSYLKGDKIIKAALDTGADAIHPGYGFLSENADFAEKVRSAGLIFIGPSSASIRVMGSKLAAKEAVKAYGIPLVPGIDRAVDDVDEAKQIAESIGYPVLIKASAGGGGKGMRIVHSSDTLEEQMKRATSEALSAFGDGAVFVEKYVTSPRHVEIQILADQHGHIVHLFERECSIQRRHQKVVEESPSPLLDHDLRMKMGQAATDVARSCDYEGAGTVEFLMDADRNFYFLEMNTRLQVEHPITEIVTGVDLVEQQIKVARGEPLSFAQEDLKIQGHAIELRVYAEDPANDFLPSVGTLEVYAPPSGAGIRVDDGFDEGMEVPIFYDPMLSKLVTYGSSRTKAIGRMIAAIDAYHIEGIKTTLPFGKFVMQHANFIKGTYDTHFVQNHFSAQLLEEAEHQQHRIAALAALHFYRDAKNKLRLHHHDESLWARRRSTD